MLHTDVLCLRGILLEWSSCSSASLTPYLKRSTKESEGLPALSC